VYPAIRVPPSLSVSLAIRVPCYRHDLRAIWTDCALPPAPPPATGRGLSGRPFGRSPARAERRGLRAAGISPRHAGRGMARPGPGPAGCSAGRLGSARIPRRCPLYERSLLALAMCGRRHLRPSMRQYPRCPAHCPPFSAAFFLLFYPFLPPVLMAFEAISV